MDNNRLRCLNEMVLDVANGKGDDKDDDDLTSLENKINLFRQLLIDLKAFDTPEDDNRTQLGNAIDIQPDTENDQQ